MREANARTPTPARVVQLDDDAAPPNGAQKQRFRTIWISDFHLGTKGCKARILLDFLKHTESTFLYLVGDIVDGQQLARSWFWPQGHNDVIQKLLRKARKGTRILFVPGNHDAAARAYAGLSLGGIRIEPEVVHRTADGKRFWVTHGDEFDHVVNGMQWLSTLGDRAYGVALFANSLFNRARRRMGKPYWSLSSHLKNKVKAVVNFVCGYRESLIRTARERGLDGVICGHVHRAEIVETDGVLYCNDGDWVESCTALVEHANGKLELLDWIAVRQMCLFEAHV
jgi:UDP-2,3-diacylglucosamine pyrophosphatase LpxH